MTSLPTDPHHSRAITLLSLASFASAAATRLCDAMLPELAKTFSTTAAEAAHTVSFFAISYGLLQAFYGTLGDRIGKYRLIAAVTLLSTLTTAAAIFAPTLDALVFARLLAGATTAGVIPLSMAWIGDTVPYEHRQATLARFLAGPIFGFVGGQFIGGFFSDVLGWRWAFVFLAVVYLVIGAFVLRESRINPLARHQGGMPLAKIGVFSQIAKVLKIRWARLILCIVFIEGMLIFGPLAFTPSYLHARFDVSLSLAGVLMLAFGLGGLVYTFFARLLVRRLGETGLAGIGGLLLALAWLTLTFQASWLWTPLATFLTGLGYYMLHNTLQTNATQMAPAVRGTAVSLFASCFFLGQSLGVILAAKIFDSFGVLALFIGAAGLTPILSAIFAALLSLHHRQAS